MKKILLLAYLLVFFICTGSVFGQCYEFYGISDDGGESNIGAIFRFDEKGNHDTIYDFPRIEGYWPHGDLCKATNGKLYGMTPAGGKYGGGVIFEWDPFTSTYSKKINFNKETNGNMPYGSLIQAKNGKFYGMTIGGGINDLGVIFEWNPSTNICIKRFDFNGPDYGSKPYGSLLEATNGLLYGMTKTGGINNQGILFEWDPVENIFVKRLDFTGRENGSQPCGSLIQANNGKLYGMTYKGGLYDCGVLFEWDPVTNSFSKKLDFNGTENGSHPQGSLLQASDGNLYGITYSGGILNDGVLFEWNLNNNIYTKKFDFGSADYEGSHSTNSLIELGNGNLAGITGSGGISSDGVLFEWDPDSNVYCKKFYLNNDIGSETRGSLIEAENGKLYGMSYQGGIPGPDEWNFSYGVLFEWDPSTDTCSVKLKFREAENGASPKKMVMLDNGLLYGITRSGGKYNYGVLFELDPRTNKYTKKFDFRMNPVSLINGGNGILYGIISGGLLFENEQWNLFIWDTVTNRISTQFTFEESDGPNSGLHPYDDLIRLDNSKIYGTTFRGGQFEDGILYEWDPVASSFVKKHDMDGRCLILRTKAGNGKLYGTADCCSTPNCAQLFELDPITDCYVSRLDFNDSVFVRSLIQTPNDKFYGAASSINRGIFYEWDAETNIYSIKLEFQGLDDGNYPLGYDMTLGDNGKLYGTIYLKENSDYFIYEWDPLRNSFRKFIDLNWMNGTKLTNLIIKRKNSPTSMRMITACDNFISPSSKYIWTESGEYQDTIPTAMGCDSVITIHLTILKSTNSINYATACNSYTSPSGKYVWTESGTYQDTIPNASGCDSILTIHLSVNKNSGSVIYVTACNTYFSPSGKLWTYSGEYFDTIPGSIGCDSIIAVNLTIVFTDTTVIQNQETLTSHASGASYQWIDCDNGNLPIEEATQQSFAPITSGNYALIVTQNGCTDTSSCYTIFKTGLISSSFKQHIALYPNPNDGSFFVDLGRVCSNVVITVSTPDGRTVKHINSYFLQKTRMILDEPPGVYLLTIDSDNQRAVFRIVKE